jgi:hypothetical protein
MEDSPIQDSASTDSASSDRAGTDRAGTDRAGTDRAGAPARPKGPNGSAVVLGLVAVIVAALVIATETMNLRVDWLALGPGAIVGIGALLVVLGAVGLVRRHGDG